MSVRRRGRQFEVRWSEGGRKLSRSFLRAEDARAFDVDIKRRKQLGALAPGIIQSRRTLAEFVEEEWWPRYAILNLAPDTRSRIPRGVGRAPAAAPRRPADAPGAICATARSTSSRQDRAGARRTLIPFSHARTRCHCGFSRLYFHLAQRNRWRSMRWQSGITALGYNAANYANQPRSTRLIGAARSSRVRFTRR